MLTNISNQTARLAIQVNTQSLSVDDLLDMSLKEYGSNINNVYVNRSSRGNFRRRGNFRNNNPYNRYYQDRKNNSTFERNQNSYRKKCF